MVVVVIVVVVVTLHIILHRDISKFVKVNVCEAFRAELQKTKVKSYEPFENLYLRV